MKEAYVAERAELYLSVGAKNKMGLKRGFDILLSFSGLILSSPLWLVFTLMIWLEDRGSIFYTQERVGKDGKVFTSFKFRSMVPNAEEGVGPLQAEENDPRITRVGKFLRATAMDELPQLLNILKGDMSFVGPRALRPLEIEVREPARGNPTAKIDKLPNFKLRSSVRPGLTGLAQIYAPRDITKKNKFRYDLLYIKNQSLWLDIKLILLSFWITLKRKWETREYKI